MTTTEKPFRPLEGIRVVEISNFIAAPLVGMLLADLGANVIKIETGSGDRSRQSGMRALGDEGGEAVAFLSFNRGKMSFVANLKDPRDGDIVRGLVADCDVVVENLRPGVLGRAALDYETAAKSNPGLIYCSISAFGDSGPYRDLPGVDSTIQAIAGSIHLTGHSHGGAVKPALPTADYLTGVFSAYGILAALAERTLTGHGRLVQTSLLSSQMFALAPREQEFQLGGYRGERVGSGHPAIVPFNTYRTSDSSIMLCVLSDAEWERLRSAVGLPAEERFATAAARLEARTEIDGALASLFLRQDTAHWLEVLRKADLLTGPVNDLGAALSDPQVLHNATMRQLGHPKYGTISLLQNPVLFNHKQIGAELRPPLLGEHTESITKAGWSVFGSYPGRERWRKAAAHSAHNTIAGRAP